MIHKSILALLGTAAAVAMFPTAASAQSGVSISIGTGSGYGNSYGNGYGNPYGYDPYSRRYDSRHQDRHEDLEEQHEDSHEDLDEIHDEAHDQGLSPGGEFAGNRDAALAFRLPSPQLGLFTASRPARRLDHDPGTPA